MSLGVDEPDGALTGIYQDYGLLGRVAVERVMAKLYANDFGPLSHPQLHFVAGVWAPGVTAPGPRRCRPAAASLRARRLVRY